jgi:hypothetical protein
MKWDFVGVANLMWQIFGEGNARLFFIIFLKLCF